MKRVTILFLFVFSFKIYSQELYFERPSQFQNLPSLESYDALQDSKGFMWITTDGGLCRFNGVELTTYTTANGIAENVVLKIYEDTHGRIWFNTLSGYVFYFENNSFHQIGANQQLKKLCIPYPTHSFFIGEKDTLFIATTSIPGFLKIPPQNNYSTVIHIIEPFEHFTRLVVLNKLKNEESIINRGLAVLNTKNSTYWLSMNGKPVLLTFPNYIAQTGRGASDYEGNVYLPFGKQLAVVRKKDLSVEYYNFQKLIITVKQDKEGDLWIGFKDGGGYLFKNSNLKKTPLPFLYPLSVCSISIDREGSIWVATLERGVFKSNSKNITWFPNKGAYFLKDSIQLKTGFVSNHILSWFKNDSFCIDGGPARNIPFEYELTAFTETDDYFYYATNYRIFYRTRNDTTAYFTLNENHRSIDLFKMNGDTVLTTGGSKALVIYKNKIIHLLRAPVNITFSKQLKDKTILIGSRNDNGLYKFKNNQFIPYLSNIPQLKTRINCVVEDSAGNLWMATNEHGIYCYDHQKQFHVFNEKNILITNKINSLTLDSSSNIWAATNIGIIKINYSPDFKKTVVTNFNKNHGIPNLQIEKTIEFNGRIWCITKENIFSFNAERQTINKTPPFVYIQTATVNDKNVDETDSLILKHNQNNIHIQSTLISYKSTDKKEFLYKLEGYDKKWHYSTTGDIQYSNLDHGTYHFIIYGLNNDKLKSSKPAVFTFFINRPFWLTWWFVSLEFLVFGLASYYFFNYWKNKIEKREQEKVHAKQQISEFKMTALRAQMNPHFIFNAIGSIQHYILKNEVKQSYNYLSKFSLLIRNILNNSRNEYISLSQEINTLKLYVELEQIRFKIPFKFIIEIDEELDMETDIPTMLIQPYIENSIWHGLMPKETQGTLVLLFKKEHDLLIVTIKDNGVGRNLTKTSKSNHVSHGMSLTEQRIQVLEATNQKKFASTIIDLKDLDNKPLGTEVKLSIPIDIID